MECDKCQGKGGALVWRMVPKRRRPSVKERRIVWRWCPCRFQKPIPDQRVVLQQRV